VFLYSCLNQKQLCFIDADLFKRIGRAELLSLKWSGPDKIEHAPNIVSMTSIFNDVSSIH
jgi:hypothetical protein